MSKRFVVSAAVLIALAATSGCGAEAKGHAASPTTITASIPASPSPSPPPSPTPTAVPFGQSLTAADGWVATTVYAYQQPIAKNAPRPDQDGFTWAAADVKVCSQRKPDEDPISVSHGPWALVYADSTRITASSTGYEAFPKPEYPWGDTIVTSGRCVRGWITFGVPPTTRPSMVEYLPRGANTPSDWVVA